MQRGQGQRSARILAQLDQSSVHTLQESPILFHLYLFSKRAHRAEKGSVREKAEIDPVSGAQGKPWE